MHSAVPPDRAGRARSTARSACSTASGSLHEVTTFRRDVATDGRHAVVAYGVSLDEDLARRDFTINAIAYHPLRHEWRDPFGGERDLAPRRGARRGRSRPSASGRTTSASCARCASPRGSGSRSSPPPGRGRDAAAPGLGQLSAERVRDEWFKGLRTARAAGAAARAVARVRGGAAESGCPSCRRRAGAARATVSPPTARSGAAHRAAPGRRHAAALRRLAASNAEIERAAADRDGPGRAGGRRRAASVRQLARGRGPRGGRPDSPLHALRTRAGPRRGLPRSARIRERGDPLTRGDLAVTGADLQALGAAGPQDRRDCWRCCSTGCWTIPRLNTARPLLALARELL